MDRSTASFIVEHDDSAAGLRKYYVLSYWDTDGSVAMYDKHAKRQFLKRTVPPEKPLLSAFYVGSTVVICSRPLKVLDYADDATRRRFASLRGSCLMMVKPEAYHHVGKIINMVYAADLNIGRLRIVRFKPEDAEAFYSLNASGATAEQCLHLTKDHMFAIEVVGDDVFARLHELVGPSDPEAARAILPSSIRAVFGEDRVRNVVHVSIDAESAKKEISFIFEGELPYTGIFTHCAACIIKPHAVAARQTGHIIDGLLRAGFEISAARTIVLSSKDAVDYLEAYRTVYPEYERWVQELSSGPAIVLEVRGEAVVDDLRDLAGPYDPEIARIIRPGCLRASYGVDKVKNALHVTDLSNDGPLECKFFFYVLEDS